MNNNAISCDHPCPLHESCARYLQGFDRKKIYHVDPMPYKNGKCSLFVALTEDDLIEKVNRIINPKLN
jgi:hypothetical protein